MRAGATGVARQRGESQTADAQLHWRGYALSSIADGELTIIEAANGFPEDVESITMQWACGLQNLDLRGSRAGRSQRQAGWSTTGETLLCGESPSCGKSVPILMCDHPPLGHIDEKSQWNDLL